MVWHRATSYRRTLPRLRLLAFGRRLRLRSLLAGKVLRLRTKLLLP